MNKLKQISKLGEIKELRRKLAEMEVARATKSAQQAEDALSRAKMAEEVIRREGAEKTAKRLSQLMNQPENAPLRSARVVNVFKQGDLEKQSAREQIHLRKNQLDDARQNLRTQQQKLARYLQVEERTRKLCENLQAQKDAEELRKS